MARKNKQLPDTLQIWIEARKRYHLSHRQIQMARELGMNPQKLGKLANHQQERWKVPLPEFIEELYLKRFGQAGPDRAMSIEEWAKEIKRKKREKSERKRARRKTDSQGWESGNLTGHST